MFLARPFGRNPTSPIACAGAPARRPSLFVNLAAARPAHWPEESAQEELIAPPPLIAPATRSRLATSPAANRPPTLVVHSTSTIRKPQQPLTVPSAVQVTSKRSLKGSTPRRSNVSGTLGEIRDSRALISSGIRSRRQNIRPDSKARPRPRELSGPGGISNSRPLASK